MHVEGTLCNRQTKQSTRVPKVCCLLSAPQKRVLTEGVPYSEKPVMRKKVAPFCGSPSVAALLRKCFRSPENRPYGEEAPFTSGQAFYGTSSVGVRFWLSPGAQVRNAAVRRFAKGAPLLDLIY